MTIRNIKTTEIEANEILEKGKRIIFRASQYYEIGNKITFLVFKKGKPVLNKIQNKRYEITAVLTNENAPIEPGYTVIGFKEI